MEGGILLGPVELPLGRDGPLLKDGGTWALAAPEESERGTPGEDLPPLGS